MDRARIAYDAWRQSAPNEDHLPLWEEKTELGKKRWKAVVAALDAALNLPMSDDPRVQKVYEILCDNTPPPNQEEHWEGWKAQRIVAVMDATSKEGENDGLRRKECFWPER